MKQGKVTEEGIDNCHMDIGILSIVSIIILVKFYGGIDMKTRHKVVILERYQLSLDGYNFRLENDPNIEISGEFLFVEDFETHTFNEAFDLLICGIDVPISRENPNPYPIISFLDKVKIRYPQLKILVISYINLPQLTCMLTKKQLDGFILKNDQQAIQNLAKIVDLICSGGVYFSKEIQKDLMEPDCSNLLTPRQYEILMLCASNPDEDTANLAHSLHISDSTLRNILSQIYKKLDVRTKAAAIIKARRLGIIPSDSRVDNYHLDG